MTEGEKSALALIIIYPLGIIAFYIVSLLLIQLYWSRAKRRMRRIKHRLDNYRILHARAGNEFTQAEIKRMENELGEFTKRFGGVVG